MNLRRLGQHLEDLRDLRSKLHFLITEVETELRRQRASEAASAPVKAFENHWKSMGKPAAAPTWIEVDTWKTADEIKATASLPMEYTVWGRNHNLLPMTLDADAIMAALKKTGWKAVSIPPEPQADGHVDPPLLTQDEVDYAAYRHAVHGTGPYYTFEAWRAMGKPRG